MLTLSFEPFPTLHTDRLVLRRVEERDAPEVFFLRSDSTVMKYLDKAPAASIDEAIEFIRMIRAQEETGDSVTWALTLKGNDTLIGTICIWNISKQNHRGEIGYTLHPNYQGQGIMQEAVTVVLDYGFRAMKLHSMAGNVNPNNAASIKLLERNGFVREAYFKEDYFFDGKFVDSAIYSLLTPERR